MKLRGLGIAKVNVSEFELITIKTINNKTQGEKII